MMSERLCSEACSTRYDLAPEDASELESVQFTAAETVFTPELAWEVESVQRLRYLQSRQSASISFNQRSSEFIHGSGTGWQLRRQLEAIRGNQTHRLAATEASALSTVHAMSSRRIARVPNSRRYTPKSAAEISPDRFSSSNV